MTNEEIAKFFNTIRPHIQGNPNLHDPPGRGMVPQTIALPQQRCSQVRQVARWLCMHQHFLFLAHIADARLYGVPHAPALPDRARAFRRTEKALEALLQGRGSQTAPKTTTGELKNIMPALITRLGKLMIRSGDTPQSNLPVR